MLFLFIIILLSTIAIVVYHSHIKLKININSNNIVHNITIYICYGIIKYKVEISLLDFINNISYFKNNLIRKGKKKKVKDMLKHNKQMYKLNKEIISYLIKKLYIYDMSLNIKYGLNDAFVTGVIYGAAYLIIINIIAWMKRNINLELNNISIKPVFNKNIYEMEFNCIIDIKLGNIITALRMFVNTSRGSDINGRVYRKSYEDNYGKY